MSHLGLYLPGGYMPGDDLVEHKPHAFVERLAWVTLRALEQTGATVEAVLYDALSFLDFDSFRAGVIRDVPTILDSHRPDRLTLVGKSMGTSALGVILQQRFELPPDTRLIWITPTWRHDASWELARTSTIESLYIVGLADDHHLPDRHATMPGRTVAIEGADHRLEVAGDVFATLTAWRTMAEAVRNFASRESA